MNSGSLKGTNATPGKRTNSSWSSASSTNPLLRSCKCGEDLLLLTSKTSANPGRNFWRCPNWGRMNSCNYFRWADEEVTQQVGKEELVHFPVQQAEEFRRKNVKLQKKLAAEKTKENICICLLVISWVVTTGVCLFCAVKCHCNCSLQVLPAQALRSSTL